MCMVTFNWEETDAWEKVNKFQKTNSLTWVVLELTNMCNFNCMWCYASSNLKGLHMSRENAERIVEKLADSGIKQITYSGGEPLMHPNINDLVKEAKDRGLIVHMNTNGYFLTKKLARNLCKSGLSQVQIDIDSLNSEIHDRIRGKKGSFKGAVRALKNAKEAGLTCVCQTVLTKMNENEALDIFKFARNFGIERCRVSDMTSEGRAMEKTDIRPLNYIETLKKLSDFAYKSGAKNIECGEPLFPFKHITNFEIVGGTCPATIGMFTLISNSGVVNFCGVHRRPLYNIYEVMKKGHDLNSFHSKALKEFLELKYTSSKCRSCSNFKKCQGGCPARCNQATDSYDYWCHN